MAAPRDPSTLMRAAYLYYVEDRSQAAIAEELGTSRSNVSRMLDEAKRQGIVEIRLNDPSGRHRQLEEQLATRFGLTEARVAPRGARSGASAEDRVGGLAAGLLLESLKEPMTVALSWGSALQSMVFAVTTDADHDVTVVQLLGGVSAVNNDISGQELVRELAVRLGASYRLLHAPATLESAQAARSLLEESSVRAALGLARSADLAFVGVGDPTHGSSAAVLESLRLDEEEDRDFWARGPVGDLAGRYVTASGEPVGGPVEERVVGVNLADLNHIPVVYGVAVGRSKTTAVLGALRGHHVDGLVVDEALARSLLSH
ncbi:MarR family transcriptional regulator [Nocardioides sp. cx-169]|uniref:sugar-binding transcriptional regulator n=1 Tax=Nocardioides sp. cx-169 TaxID=2899080 RepID=UPI001E4BC97D|nr:sugar-binding domain-containing protein [Nocardioides sp. cx-169]MCD4533821.1 MarR family transcriptional regulator [Nocardioides sp. cx-169]